MVTQSVVLPQSPPPGITKRVLRRHSAGTLRGCPFSVKFSLRMQSENFISRGPAAASAGAIRGR
jgi:hypothetical protein